MTAIQEVVKVFLENMEMGLPDYVEMDGPYTRWGGEGITAYVMYKLQDDKAAEALNLIITRDARFADIAGYKIKYELVLNIEDSLAIVGAKMP